MLRTFNCGIGMCVITNPKNCKQVITNLNKAGEKAYIIGHLENKKNNKNIVISNKNQIFDK